MVEEAVAAAEGAEAARAALESELEAMRTAYHLTSVQVRLQQRKRITAYSHVCANVAYIPELALVMSHCLLHPRNPYPDGTHLFNHAAQTLERQQRNHWETDVSMYVFSVVTFWSGVLQVGCHLTAGEGQLDAWLAAVHLVSVALSLLTENEPQRFAGLTVRVVLPADTEEADGGGEQLPLIQVGWQIGLAAGF